jgi:hypothetical protein
VHYSSRSIWCSTPVWYVRQAAHSPASPRRVFCCSILIAGEEPPASPSTLAAAQRMHGKGR